MACVPKCRYFSTPYNPLKCSLKVTKNRYANKKYVVAMKEKEKERKSDDDESYEEAEEG